MCYSEVLNVSSAVHTGTLVELIGIIFVGPLTLLKVHVPKHLQHAILIPSKSTTPGPKATKDPFWREEVV